MKDGEKWDRYSEKRTRGSGHRGFDASEKVGRPSKLIFERGIAEHLLSGIAHTFFRLFPRS
ncbi:MAG: hypothetical protein B6A08_09275 [Sorangiineae bacterium NIC37A_2]|nr:MAG: hypothetical protein B6A08_09275 [Sorangiineae bacterium NIC37A_2]